MQKPPAARVVHGPQDPKGARERWAPQDSSARPDLKALCRLPVWQTGNYEGSRRLPVAERVTQTNSPPITAAEGVWTNLKSRLRNLAVHTVDQLTTVIRTHLKRMQYRPRLVDAIIAETGLTFAQPEDTFQPR